MQRIVIVTRQEKLGEALAKKYKELNYEVHLVRPIDIHTIEGMSADQVVIDKSAVFSLSENYGISELLTTMLLPAIEQKSTKNNQPTTIN